MPGLKVKVCGMRDAENISLVSRTGPDYLGFIFHRGSSRFIDPASSLPYDLQEKTNWRKTGVFVDAGLDEILQTTRKWELDALQLHGSESPLFIGELRKRVGAQIQLIKAFAIGEGFDFESTRKYDSADFFLFDSRGALPGGNGTRFDHRLLQDYQGKTPFWLSGGLGREHLDPLLKQAADWPALYGLDFNSRLEISPGLKSLEKTQDIMENIHAYNNKSHAI